MFEERILAYGDVYARLSMLFRQGRRIGLSGSSGVGKTTFARLLSRGTGATVHQEAAREWLRQNRIDAYWKMSAMDVARMQTSILEGYETSHCNVYDRTTIDAIFFAQRAAGALDLEEFERRAAAFAAGLDAIVFFPYRSEYLRHDGVRLIDPTYQLKCGAFILSKLSEHDLEDRTIIFQHHMSPEENIELIVRELEQK